MKTEEKQESKKASVFEFPIEFNIKQIDINNTKVEVAGVKLNLEQLVLSAKGVDNNLKVSSSIKGLTVILTDTKIPPKNSLVKQNKKATPIN